MRLIFSCLFFTAYKTALENFILLTKMNVLIFINKINGVDIIIIIYGARWLLEIGGGNTLQNI